MSVYYNPKRTRNLFNPKDREPFRLSRSKIDDFFNCPRCFYLDRRLGISQPSGPPFALNAAVDKLLKKEFDIHRGKTAHPLMEAYGINAVPLAHQEIDKWRDSLRGGIQFLHKPTNFLVTGGIDDIWVNPQEEFIIVDYKATAKDGEVSIDAEWQESYKRQMEFYQWLFRKNNFKVSDTGYFVYCNGITDKESFDGKLEFDVKIIPYKGDDSWVEGKLQEIKEVLISDTIPKPSLNCDFCRYRAVVKEAEV